MASWIGDATVICALFIPLTFGLSCTSSSQCPASQCCRDPSTNRVLVDDPQGFLEIVQGTSGQCVAGGAQPGDMCDSTCSCPEGYECYRRVSGVCCPPRLCVTTEEANADREYWRCRPPPPLKRGVPARRLFLSTLCPEATLEAAAGGASP